MPEGLVSLTVIGPDILEADIAATAGFAMERDGIYFIDAFMDFGTPLYNHRYEMILHAALEAGLRAVHVRSPEDVRDALRALGHAG